MVYRIPPLEKGHLLSTVGTAMLLGEHAGELQKDGFWGITMDGPTKNQGCIWIIYIKLHIFCSI